MNAKLAALAKQVMEAARVEGFSLVTAESCTAGKLSNVLSEVPGAGERLHGGFVIHTKEAKTELLGVSPSFCGNAVRSASIPRSPWRRAPCAVRPRTLPLPLRVLPARSLMKTITP